MLEAMMQAKVGDDVWEEDPTVKQLEQLLASKFDMEAGLFCPSGTMANQIAIRCHTQPQDQVICDALSHIYHYEGGGVAANSAVSCKMIDGDRGRITAQQVLEHINPDDIHYPISRLVSLENTMNKGGGSCYDWEELLALHELCQSHGLALHLDGARVFNALVATGQDSHAYGGVFDSISVCLSKGLGAPVGSVLLGDRVLIKKAKRVRKMMGGGMRQVGYLAAAGIYALHHHVERLAEDHQRAKVIGELLEKQPYVLKVLPVDTNIIIFEINHEIGTEAFLQKLTAKGLLAAPFGKHYIRFVTHLGIDDEMMAQTLNILKAIH